MEKEKRTIRIGVDVGGTNTDICAIDENTGELMVYKLPSSLYDQWYQHIGQYALVESMILLPQ